MKTTRALTLLATAACAAAAACGGIDPQDSPLAQSKQNICPVGIQPGTDGIGGDLIIPCDPYPPPPPPPGIPDSLTYTPFSESSILRVRWPAKYNATSYLVDQLTNGAWSRVYTGPETAIDVFAGGNGLYRFRVAACNDYGCSGFRVDDEMRLSFGPDRQTGGSGAASSGAAFSLSSGLPGANALSTDPGTHELLPILGAAYDQIRQELTANRCLDMTNAQIDKQQARMKDYLFTHARTRDELITSLELTQNLGISAKYGKFSGTFSGKKSLVSNSDRVDETSIIVASLKDQLRVETLINHSLQPIDPTFVAMLGSGDTSRFRNICGDSYVYSIAYGRQVYLTFQLRSFKYNTETIRTQTAALKIDLASWASANFDSTRKTTIQTKYEQYEVQVRAISYGSAAVVSSVVDFATGLQYLQNFEAEAPGNEYPFSQHVADYNPPAGAPYPNYRPIQQTLQRWYSFDQQLAARCEVFDDNLYPQDSVPFETNAAPLANNLQLRSACFRMKRAVQENIQNCEDTAKWGQCIQPDSPSCGVPNEVDTCVNYANRLPKWSAAPSSLRLYAYLDTGLSSASSTARADTCFSAPTMLDLRIADIDCAGQGGCPALRKGVTVWTNTLHRASNGWNSWTPSTRCLHAEVTISRPGWWGSSAKADQTQTANGLQPTYPSFLF
jgi:hypothetical protein